MKVYRIYRKKNPPVPPRSSPSSHLELEKTISYQRIPQIYLVGTERTPSEPLGHGSPRRQPAHQQAPSKHPPGLEQAPNPESPRPFNGQDVVGCSQGLIMLIMSFAAITESHPVEGSSICLAGCCLTLGLETLSSECRCGS